MGKDSLYILFFKNKKHIKIVREKKLLPPSYTYEAYTEDIDFKKSSRVKGDTYTILKLEETLHFMFESASVFVKDDHFCFAPDISISVAHQVRVIKANGVKIKIPSMGITLNKEKITPFIESKIINKTVSSENKETLNRFIKVFYDNLDCLYYANRKNGLVIFRSDDASIIDAVFKRLEANKILKYNQTEIDIFKGLSKSENECYLKITSFTKLAKSIRDVQSKNDDYARGIKILFDLFDGMPNILKDTKYGNTFLKEKKES